MKTEYDVETPQHKYGFGKYTPIFWEFYESEHETAKYTFEDKKDAMLFYKAAQNTISRNRLRDVAAMIRKNIVFFLKY